MQKAVLFEKLPQQKVRCTACSWYCTISPHNTGICRTRFNKNGYLYSLVYGKAVGLHLDPVEKKPLYHFLPGSTFLSFGTAGCNFACDFCQNWDMSQTNKNLNYDLRFKNYESNLIKNIDKISENISPKEIVELAIKLKADGIAYTYNEPAIFAEFTHDTAKIARENGLKNVYVSNGYESKETFTYVKNYIDAINIDLKSFSQEFYQRICHAKIAPVKENIKRFFASGIETEVTTLIIPGKNDSPKELNSIAKFLYQISPNIPWHISAFYPAYKMMDVVSTPHETLVKAYDIGKKIGLKYIYLGNLPDDKRSGTFCPKCKELMIKRSGYDIEVINIKNGKCNKCGEKIYGVFE